MVIGLFVLGLPTTASAQLESLTVVVAPSATSFALTADSASNTGLLPLTVTTAWTALLGRNNVSLYAYFTNASAALVHQRAGGTVDIPSSRVEVSINTGALLPFNQTVTFGGAAAGRQIFSQNLTALTLTGVHVDALILNINLSGYSLPADTYVGTLRFRARASP